MTRRGGNTRPLFGPMSFDGIRLDYRPHRAITHGECIHSFHHPGVSCGGLSWRHPFSWTRRGVWSLRAAPFTVQGPGVNPSDFRVTAFARGLSFPLGMVPLSDGSLLVAVTAGNTFWSGNNGRLLRLTDTNQDGIADGPGTILYGGLPSGVTALRHCGNLFFVTGQGPGHPIWVLRAGATPADSLSLVGSMTIQYPAGGWEHSHSTLGVRETPGQAGSCDLLFQLGSDENFSKTTRTAILTNTNIPGAEGVLEGELIYAITLSDRTTNVVASHLVRWAKGLRNPAGFAFHPVSGDLYFEDNGIDGLVNANEPLSADELNSIPANQLDVGNVPDFGYPTNYTEYRTGRLIGGAGVQPLFAFQPLPNPFTGSESEGASEIAFAPAGFPPGLNNGLFVGFHGKWSGAGIANEENPVVFADLSSHSYFQFVGNDEPEIGHIDGMVSTDDSLFLSDLTSTGNTDASSNAGVIYQIQSLVAHVLSFQVVGPVVELTWKRGGRLQRGATAAGLWTPVTTSTNTYSVPLDPAQAPDYYRVEF